MRARALSLFTIVTLLLQFLPGAADVSAQQDALADDPSGVMTFASARRASGTTR